MWLMTTFGFFSVVRDTQHPGHLLVRSRSHNDLTELARRFDARGLDEPQILEMPLADYRYRIIAPAPAVAEVLGNEIQDINYPNFKNEVARAHSPKRAQLYSQIWMVIREHFLRRPTKPIAP